MNPKWPKWIERSVTKHFASYVNLPWNFSNEDLSDERSFCELRTDGPWFQEYPGNQWYFEMDINVLISVSDADLYELEELGGDILNLMSVPITIMNDTEEIGCMKPKYDRHRKLQFNKFGRIETNVNVEQATIENKYSIVLKGD